MWRFIILASIAPFIIGGLCANWFGLRVLTGAGTLKISVEEILRKMLTSIQRDDIEVVFVKGPIWSGFSQNGIKLPQQYKQSSSVSHLSKSLIHLGLFLLHEKHEATVRWRMKAVRLGYTLPVFVLLIALFSFVVGKLPITIVLASIAATLGLCTVMLWLSLSIEKEAAHLMVSRIEKLRILPRLSDEERLVSAIKATPWVSLIPGVFLKFMLRD